MSAGNGTCNSVYPDYATQIAYGAWTIFQGYADRGYTLAANRITELNDFTVDFTTWDLAFEETGTLSGFVRPTRPDLVPISDISLAGDIPDAPSFNIPALVLTAAPAEPSSLSSPPDLNLTVMGPDALDPDQRPGTAPELDIPDAPTEPTLETLASPTLTEITIEDAPLVTIAEFDADVPEFTDPPPNYDIDFTENAYTSALLTGLKARITDMMAGEGLPPAVAAAIYGRLVQRDDESSAKAVQEVMEEFASRGFDAEPNGILAARALEIRQTNRAKRAEANRDVFIEEQKVIVENVRFAVAQGLALEGQLIQANLAVEQRRFELAVKIKDLQVAIFGAYVQAFNARVQTFNSRVAAYNAFIDGQKAQVEVYRAQVEAAKVRGEINQQAVNLYTAQIQAQQSQVEVYKAQVEGFRARIEAEKTRIEAYGAEVDSYKAFVEAYKTEWEAEATRIGAEVQRGKIYETMANVYATRVDAWKTAGDAKIQEHRENSASLQLLLQQHQAQVAVVLGKLEAAKANLQAQIATQTAKVQIYQADAAVEGTAVDSDTRAFQAITAREQARLELVLKDAQLQITQINQNAALLLEATKSAANAAAQLTASAMSAVNFSAGTSASLSRSEACSSSFNFSGSIADAP